MSTYILILFAVFNNGTATAAVRVGFDSQITCVAAAKEVSNNILDANPTAKVDWSCVKQ